MRSGVVVWLLELSAEYTASGGKSDREGDTRDGVADGEGVNTGEDEGSVAIDVPRR